MLLSFSELALLAVFGLGTASLLERDRHASQTAALTEKLQQEQRERAVEKAELEALRELWRKLQEDFDKLNPPEVIETHPVQSPVAALNALIAGLKHDIAAMRAQAIKAKQELKRANQDLAVARERAKILAEQLKDANARVAALADVVSDLRTRLGAADGLEDLIAKLRLRIKELEGVAEASASNDLVLRRELVGLAGRLRNVVFIFDGSFSLRESGRWQESVDLLKRWVETLEVERCGVVSFTGKAVAYRHYLAKVSGDANAPARAGIARWLDGRKAGPGSNLLGALKFAHSMDGIDSIVLFTDGRVDSKSKIRRWLRERKAAGANVPINVIAVGDYIQTSASEFLRELSTVTGGSFRGR